MQTTAPLATNERILTLDVVRGVALLGIFIMNMPYFSMSFFSSTDELDLWPLWWDSTAKVLRDVLFSGKFNSMFSLLFAVGFTIQFQRLIQNAGTRGVSIYLRRLFWLLAFGVVHACIFWTGDVLHMYAIFGFVLLAIRRWPDRVIVVLIVACLLYAPIRGLIRLNFSEPSQLDAMYAAMRVWEESNNAAYGAGSFLDAAREHTGEMIFSYSDPDILMSNFGFYVQIFTTMLLGLLVGRHELFQRAPQHLDKVRRVQWWALGIGVITGITFGVWEATVENRSEPTVWGVVAGTSYALCRVSVMIFYVALLIRGVADDRWRTKLAPFALAGRMPLSNYLLQTLVATTLFYGWGLGMWGKVGPLFQLVIAVAFFFVVQIPLSVWWLKRFELGPMEYLWRRLTYGRFTQAQSA